jgi:hypothetical protein
MIASAVEREKPKYPHYCWHPVLLEMGKPYRQQDNSPFYRGSGNKRLVGTVTNSKILNMNVIKFEL